MGTKPRILLVDDHPGNLIALEAVLGTAEYDILTASSGPEALALAEVHDLCLVLLDIHMPGMDGYEVVRKLKTSPRTRHVPVMMITAIYREDPWVAKAYAAGAAEYFSKPFDPDVLKMKVEIYAELFRKSRNLAVKEARCLAMEQTLQSLNDTLKVALQGLSQLQ